MENQLFIRQTVFKHLLCEVHNLYLYGLWKDSEGAISNLRVCNYIGGQYSYTKNTDTE